MSYKGAIKWTGLTSNDDAELFYKQVKSRIENECNGLYTEIQYKPIIQIDGKVNYTAFIIGRALE